MASSYTAVPPSDCDFELTPVKPSQAVKAQEDAREPRKGNRGDFEISANSPRHDEATLAQPSIAVKSERSRSGSQIRLIPSGAQTYTLERYIPRWISNTLGPFLFTGLYVFIVLEYLRRPPVNDVITAFPLNAKFVFYAWLVFSIFVLDWAKSALAGFEAWALMDSRLAPRTAMQLMWHTDRAWGNVSGWLKAMKQLLLDLRHRLSRYPSQHVSKSPGGLWWYLSFSSFLFYVAVPLAGLSMDPTSAFRRSNRNITIVGTSQTSFDINNSNAVAEQANSRWRQGNPTTPHGDTVFYSPVGVEDRSSTFYEDDIQEIYHNDLKHLSAPADDVSFFSGPQVTERADGNAWGLLTNLTCSVVHPYRDLQLLQVYAIDNWTAPSQDNIITSAQYGTEFFKQEAGLLPVFFNDGVSFGVSYKYLIASDLPTYVMSDYVNSSEYPTNGSLELVVWQAYGLHSTPDGIFQNLTSDPSVVSSVWTNDSMTYLGYAVRCTVSSSTGTAHLDAARRSYSNFSSEPAVQADLLGYDNYKLNSYPGIMAIQSIVFGSFTTVVLSIEAPPVCDDSSGLSLTCNPWYGANVATGGGPNLVRGHKKPGPGNVQYPTISPARMKLAIYKLFGEASIAMMAAGSGEWTGGLHGLDHTSAIVPGKVPWQIALTLLVLWTAVTVFPSIWAFGSKRWAATLDGFEMFRLGAEWSDVVWRFEGREFGECGSLLEVPGLIGDMEAKGGRKDRFIGLSGAVARRDGQFVHDRKAV